MMQGLIVDEIVMTTMIMMMIMMILIVFLRMRNSFNNDYFIVYFPSLKWKKHSILQDHVKF